MRTRKSKFRVILLLVTVMMIECVVGIGLISVCLLVVMGWQSYKADREIRQDKMYLFKSSPKAVYWSEYSQEWKEMRENDHDNNSSV